MNLPYYPMLQDLIRNKAVFDHSRAYRYGLWRDFVEYSTRAMEIGGIRVPEYVMFIGLNPSVADENIDDNTVRRCINYAKHWGYGAMIMTNIFAYRSTDPKGLLKVQDPIGPDTDQWLQALAYYASLKIACWGQEKIAHNRGEQVATLISGLSCLGTTKDGSPKHPLYLSKNTTRVRYAP